MSIDTDPTPVDGIERPDFGQHVNRCNLPIAGCYICSRAFGLVPKED